MRKLLILLSFSLLIMVQSRLVCENPFWAEGKDDQLNPTVQLDYLSFYFSEDCWSPKDLWKQVATAKFYDNFSNLDPSRPFYGWYLKSKNPTAEKYVIFKERITLPQNHFPSSTKAKLFALPNNATIVSDGSQLTYIPHDYYDYNINKPITYDNPLPEESYILIDDSLYVIPKKTEEQFIIKFGCNLSSKDAQFCNMNVNGTLPSLIKAINYVGPSFSTNTAYFTLYDGSIWKGNYKANAGDRFITNLEITPDLLFVESYFKLYYPSYYFDSDGKKQNYPHNDTVKQILGLDAYETSKGEVYFKGQKLNDLPDEPLISLTTDIGLRFSFSTSLYLLYGDRVVIITVVDDGRIKESRYFYMNTIFLQDSEKNKYDRIVISLGHGYEIYLFSGFEDQTHVKYDYDSNIVLMVNHSEFGLRSEDFFDYVLAPNEEGQATPLNFRVHNLWKNTTSGGSGGNSGGSGGGSSGGGSGGNTGEDDNTTTQKSTASILFWSQMLLGLLLFAL